MVQWCAIEIENLLHKHFINGITLSQDYIPYESYHYLWLLAPIRYESDLSKEVLNIDFGEGASEVKFGG